MADLYRNPLCWRTGERRVPETSVSSPPATATFYSNEEIRQKYFEKKFEFKKSHKWSLPVVDSAFPSNSNKSDYCHPKLVAVKKQLNEVKNKLNNYSLEAWSKHTHKRDPAGGIGWNLRKVINAEFVTKAWSKFYEIIMTYQLVRFSDASTGEFNSMHLCEAPGAFVAALNHFLKFNYTCNRLPLNWHWCATTLNPYYEGNALSSTVLDDRLIMHTFEQWEFGEDFTGDITKSSTIDALETRASHMGKIQLVTADGSMDCMDAPQDQEDHVHFLHFAEVVAALRLLGESGNFVLKMFTFFEPATINLLYLLNVCFDQVHVFKPVTSKAGNSEVYVISIGYKRNQIPQLSNHLRMMTQYLGQSNERQMFSTNIIPNDFVDQVAQCAHCFMCHQIAAIETNIHHYHILNPDGARDKKTGGSAAKPENTQDLRNAITRTFFRYYRIEMIPKEYRLIAGERKKLPQNMNIAIYSYVGSLADRTKFLALSESDKTIALHEQMIALSRDTVGLCLNDTIQLKLPTISDQNPIAIRCGRPIMFVVSSKFILIQNLKLLLEVQRYRRSPVTMTQPWSIVRNLSDSRLATLSVNILDCGYGLDYDTFEKGIFRQLIELIGAFDVLRIDNYLLLTHFSVGLLWVLGQRVFANVQLTGDGCIWLREIRSNGRDFVKNQLAAVVPCSNELAAVSIVKLSYLTNEDFYNAIFAYNNKLCSKYCAVLLGV